MIDRIKNYVDLSEQRFEEYCQKHKGYFFRKLHLNQSDDIFTCPIPHWNRLGLLKVCLITSFIMIVSKYLLKLKQVIKLKF
jgi:hypothetical protein